MIGTIAFVERGVSVMLLPWVAHVIQSGVMRAFGADRQGFLGTGAERHLGRKHQTAGNPCWVKTLGRFPPRLLRLGGSRTRQTSKARAQAGPDSTLVASSTVLTRCARAFISMGPLPAGIRLYGGSCFI